MKVFLGKSRRVSRTATIVTLMKASGKGKQYDYPELWLQMDRWMLNSSSLREFSSSLQIDPFANGMFF